MVGLLIAIAAFFGGAIVGGAVVRRLLTTLHGEAMSILAERAVSAERRTIAAEGMLDEVRAQQLRIASPAVITGANADTIVLPAAFLAELDGIADQMSRQAFRENAEHLMRADPLMDPDALIKQAMGLEIR